MGDVPGAATFHAPAEAYDRFVGRYGQELARALCAAADVRPPGRALDVGCGPGALTTELVARLGVKRVAAVDPSAPFVTRVAGACPGSAWSWRRASGCRSRTICSTSRSLNSS